MKAVLFYEHGESEVLRYEEVPVPEPAAGEVLIAVGAVSINHGPDIETRRRGFSMGEVPMPHIGGVDPAGEIAGLGPGVEGFEVGERVAVYPVIACGVCDFCRAGAGELLPELAVVWSADPRRPGGVRCRPRRAARPAPGRRLLRGGSRSWRGLHHHLARFVRAGQRDLGRHAAGGGRRRRGRRRGRSARQDRRRQGLRTHRRRVEAGSPPRPGRRRGVQLPRQRLAREGQGRVRRAGITAAFDNAGTETLAASIDCLGRGGRLFCSGGTTGLEVNLNVRRLYREHISLLFYVQGSKADMEKLVEFTAAGVLEPVIDRRFSLRDAARADDHLDAGEQFGRVVLRVGDEE